MSGDTGRARAAPGAAPATPPGPVLGPPGPLRPPSGRCRTPRRAAPGRALPLPAPLVSFDLFPLFSPGFLLVPLFGCFGYGGAVPGVAARCPSLGQLRARRFWARRLPSRDEGTRASCRAAFPRYLHLFVEETCATVGGFPGNPAARGVTLQQLSLNDFWPQVMAFLTTPGCDDICNGIAIIAVVKNT